MRRNQFSCHCVGRVLKPMITAFEQSQVDVRLGNRADARMDDIDLDRSVTAFRDD